MKRILRRFGRFFGFYLLGIVLGVVLTPAEFTLIGRPVWLFYIPFAALGFVLFYVDLPQQYVFGSVLAYWTVYGFGLAGALGGAAALFWRNGRYRRWFAPLMGLALGFVGTLGVYYAIAAGI